MGTRTGRPSRGRGSAGGSAASPAVPEPGARRAAVGAARSGRGCAGSPGSTCSAPAASRAPGAERSGGDRTVPAPGPSFSRGLRHRSGHGHPENAAAPSLGMGFAAGSSGSVGERTPCAESSDSRPSPGTERSGMSPSARVRHGERQQLGSPDPPSTAGCGLACTVVLLYITFLLGSKEVDVPPPLGKMRLCNRQK